MLPRVSRFERSIIAAIVLCAVLPFVISLFFIPQIIESRLALSMHTEVQKQLADSAAFYKEFFDAKKKEYSARAEAIAKDPVLIRAAQSGAVDDVRHRLEQVLTDNPEIQSIRVFTAENKPLVALEGPAERQTDDYRPKTITLPLGVGDAPRLEAVFILSKKYLEDREQAERIARIYDTALKTQNDRARSFYIGYIVISAVVVLIALFVGFFLARSVTKRIYDLSRATDRVAKGESGFMIPVRGNDEITELTDGFNRMIEEVAEARDRIVYLKKISGWQEFARRLAHEIKNPLTPIRLSIQELRRRVPEEDPSFKKLLQDATDVVEEEIGALTRLVDEFSQFARLPEVTPAPAEMGAFLEEFLHQHRHFEPEAHVELELKGAPIAAMVDRVLFRRVLANLITNGIQAAGNGKAEISLRCAPIPATRLIEIRVEDNGPGVTQEEAEKIFEPYFTTKSEGTGLGLAIVKKIVLQHGGSIALRRSPRGGAAFVILLQPADLSALEESEEHHQDG